MRLLFTITLPTASFNAAVRDGSVGKKLGAILEATKPEAIYFTERDGQRCAVAVYDIAESSKIPSLCEPWFLTFEAKVQTHPAMTAEDLKNGGLEALGKKWAGN